MRPWLTRAALTVATLILIELVASQALTLASSGAEGAFAGILSSSVMVLWWVLIAAFCGLVMLMAVNWRSENQSGRRGIALGGVGVILYWSGISLNVLDVWGLNGLVGQESPSKLMPLVILSTIVAEVIGLISAWLLVAAARGLSPIPVAPWRPQWGVSLTALICVGHLAGASYIAFQMVTNPWFMMFNFVLAPAVVMMLAAVAAAIAFLRRPDRFRLYFAIFVGALAAALFFAATAFVRL